MAQMTELKRLLRVMRSEYFVTKKTLMDLALKGKNYDGLNIYKMEGSIGLVMGEDDPYAVAKKVYEFSRKNPSLHLWGALMDGKFFSKEGFLEIAKMPSREVLLGRLVGMLTYPMRGLAVVLGEIAKSKVYKSEARNQKSETKLEKARKSKIRNKKCFKFLYSVF